MFILFNHKIIFEEIVIGTAHQTVNFFTFRLQTILYLNYFEPYYTLSSILRYFAVLLKKFVRLFILIRCASL